MMSHLKKAQRTADAAYTAYRSACADAVAYALTADSEDPELARLRRRSAAHHTRWLAAENRAETMAARDDHRMAVTA